MTLLTPKELLRFQAKIAVAGPDECWNWTACTTGARALGWYGRFCLRNKRYYAHRVAWCVARGFPLEYLTDHLAVMHNCDNPLCCNPSHLTLGTQLDNVKDMIRKARHRNGSSGRRKQTPVEIPI
jgi:hypothetical protein